MPPLAFHRIAELADSIAKCIMPLFTDSIAKCIMPLTDSIAKCIMPLFTDSITMP
jgi:hypothetical protein